MPEKPLTDEMIQSGAHLIAELDRKGSSPDAAYWYYFPDIQAWKLVIAQESIRRVGPRELYKKIQGAIHTDRTQRSSFSLLDVAVSRPDSPILRLLRSVVRTGPELAHVRLENVVVNGVPIESAYVYRTTKAKKKQP